MEHQLSQFFTNDIYSEVCPEAAEELRIISYSKIAKLMNLVERDV
jgi:hypothetical protein